MYLHIFNSLSRKCDSVMSPVTDPPEFKELLLGKNNTYFSFNNLSL